MTTIPITAEKSKKLAHNLQSLLRQKKLSEQELALALKMPVMTVRRLVSGETEDPRISTLKLIADYFGITVDSLVENETIASANIIGKSKPLFIPILDWATAEKIKSLKEIDLASWKNWQPISLKAGESISEKAFALESRPSMYPRFPQGTYLIIDPDAEPSDGDIILLKIKKHKDITLRELSIDPPEWRLQSIVSETNVMQYSEKDHEILGVILLTLFYSRKYFT